jgi:hypothetical protein
MPGGKIGLGGGGVISFKNSRAQCPRCGRAMEVIPGRYEEGVANQLNILIDPSISPEALEAIRRLAERAKAGKITPEEAKQEAEKISPKAGKLFDVANWSDQAKADLYAAIIKATGAIIASTAAVIVAAKMASSPAPSVTVNIQPVIERIETRKETLRGTTSHTPPGHLPKPKPKPRPRPR